MLLIMRIIFIPIDRRHERRTRDDVRAQVLAARGFAPPCSADTRITSNTVHEAEPSTSQAYVARATTQMPDEQAEVCFDIEEIAVTDITSNDALTEITSTYLSPSTSNIDKTNIPEGINLSGSGDTFVKATTQINTPLASAGATLISVHPYAHASVIEETRKQFKTMLVEASHELNAAQSTLLHAFVSDLLADPTVITSLPNPVPNTLLSSDSIIIPRPRVRYSESEDDDT
jgi:hypothetical protein